MKKIKAIGLAFFAITKLFLLIIGFIKIEKSESDEEIKNSLLPLFIFIFVAEAIQLLMFLFFGIKLLKGL